MPRASYAGAFRIRFVSVLTAMYIAMVLLVTMWPTPVDRGLDSYLDRVLGVLHRHGVPGFVSYGFIEFTANIVFFVPVGFLLALLFTFRLQWVAIPCGAALSAAIETTQGLLLPDRVADITDVIANSSGTMLGCVVAVAVRALILHRDVLVIRDVSAGLRSTDGLRVRRDRLR